MAEQPMNEKLRGDELELWTKTVNAVVDILKIEMNGGFLENTAKYAGQSEDIIHSCLRAIAVQILALFPDIEKAQKQEGEDICQFLIKSKANLLDVKKIAEMYRHEDSKDE